MESTPKRKRIVACDACRARKVRCNGSTPCSHCVDRGEQCTITSRKQRARNYGGDELDERLARIEAMMGNRPSPATSNSLHYVPTHSHVQPNPMQSTTPSAPFILPVATTDTPRDNPQQNSSNDGNSDDRNEDGSIFSPWATNFEYAGKQHCPGATNLMKLTRKNAGPQAFLSICSRPGVHWVNKKLGNDSFQSVASKLVRDFTRRLRLQTSIPKERAPSPTDEDAWRYARAYFENAKEVPFGVLLGPRFEENFRKFLAGTLSEEEDPARRAIFYAVMACGARICYSDNTSFKQSVAISAGLFENALGMHTEILYRQASMLGVQALTIMAYFADGLGGPSLQYMLSSCAIRLAVAKGLHRQPSPSWNLREDEMRHRNWVFWAAYCIERAVASRNGRPPAIDDDEISCEIPSVARDGTSTSTTYCVLQVKMAQLRSRVSKQLTSAAALKQSASSLLNAVKTLQQELDDLKPSLESIIPVNDLFDLQRIPSGLSALNALRLRSIYYELVFRIHSSLAHPWFRSLWGDVKNDPSFLEQIRVSTNAMMDASRAAILNLAFVRINAYTALAPALMLPLSACINIFTHVLSEPNLPTVQSDLALLDVGAAHFSRLELQTESTYSITFVRDLAKLARNLLSSQAAVNVGQNVDASPNLGTVEPSDDNLKPELENPDTVQNVPIMDDFFDPNLLDFEMWSTMVPIDLDFTDMDFPM